MAPSKRSCATGLIIQLASISFQHKLASSDLDLDLVGITDIGYRSDEP